MTFADCKNAGSCGKDLCLPEFCHQFDPKQKTNADRIRAMSDEELAEWIARTQIGAIKDAMNLLRLPYDEPDGLVEMGKTEALEWLKQPAEELNDGNEKPTA